MPNIIYDPNNKHIATKNDPINNVISIIQPTENQDIEELDITTIDAETMEPREKKRKPANNSYTNINSFPTPSSSTNSTNSKLHNPSNPYPTSTTIQPKTTKENLINQDPIPTITIPNLKLST
jgi:hypothetical protein